jgi:very-short-patch-repair endonuclease
MIAQCLAQGKSVLFVAEKAVALEVVRERLEKLGLGDYCLELHSSKAKKVEVMRQLGASLDREAEPGSDDFLRSSGETLALRAELNTYVQCLHRKRDTGESAFLGLSRLAGLVGSPRVDLGWGAGESVPAERLQALRLAMDRLKVAARRVQPLRVHPWRELKLLTWTPTWQDRVARELKALQESVRCLAERHASSVELLGLQVSAALELDGAIELVRNARCLVEGPPLPRALLVTRDFPESRARAETLIASGRARDATEAAVAKLFVPEIFDEPLARHVARLQRAKRHWAPLAWLIHLIVYLKIRRFFQEQARINIRELGAPLSQAADRIKHQAFLEEQEEMARSLFERSWTSKAGEWDMLQSLVDRADRVRTLAFNHSQRDPERAAKVLEHWALVISEAGADWGPTGPYAIELTETAALGDRVAAGLNTLMELLGQRNLEVLGQGKAKPTLDGLSQRLSFWIQALAELEPWYRWCTARAEVERLGAVAIACGVEHGEIEAEAATGAFERSYYEWWTRTVFSQDPALHGFDSAWHERRIEQFQKLDEEHRHHSIAALRHRLSGQRQPPADREAKAEVAIIRREAQKKTRHKAIRQLMGEAGASIARLKPCFLMSPISVAQYLDPTLPLFDLVIFDEASQIAVWDAIGALARGKSAVVVGDPKQLPPTSFFGRGDSSPAEGDDDLEDLESILDDCIASGIPSLHLNWHYRSQHESLIAFSNYHYYGRSLLTFPSSDTTSSLGHGVSLRYFEHGRFDRGGTRTNKVEAAAIVEEVVGRLLHPQGSASILVVTLNIQQMALIEELLDAKRRVDPTLDARLSSGDGQRLSVKNLENVQGDERDTVLFSIAFSQDARGTVSMNFGAMNRENGHRRLNVAITRARKEVIVFSSLRADQLDLTRTKARGVQDLKAFLEFAERGTSSLGAELKFDADAEFDSPLEQQICERLRNKGLIVHPQVGCSGYRIDLGVVDASMPGRYVLGVECDGATYHRAATARDRDKLRQSVLEGLGWTMHRIWSTDWWRNPDREVHRVLQAVENAQRARSLQADSASLPSCRAS